MNTFRAFGAALAAVLILPASSALAAGATVTGDDGAQTPLGANPTIRHMGPDVKFSFEPSETYYSVSITGPAGKPASPGSSCGRTTSAYDEHIRYQGNGQYTVKLLVSRTADDSACAEATEQVFTFTINAFTGIQAPASNTLLTRRPDSVSLITYDVPVDLNPGADSYDLRFARNATLTPDGDIAGDASTAFVSTETGKAQMSFSSPGRYTLVVRAKVFTADGTVTTAWGPPVTVTAVAPFDMFSPTFPDARGPSYKLSGVLRESSARGKIAIAIAKGKKSKKFRKLGNAKLRKGGKFSLRFKLRKAGTYRLRYTFKGSATTDSGVVTQVIRIRRRSFF